MKVKFLCTRALQGTLAVTGSAQVISDLKRQLGVVQSEHGKPVSSTTLAVGPGAGAVLRIELSPGTCTEYEVLF